MLASGTISPFQSDPGWSFGSMLARLHPPTCEWRRLASGGHEQVKGSNALTACFVWSTHLYGCGSEQGTVLWFRSWSARRCGSAGSKVEYSQLWKRAITLETLKLGKCKQNKVTTQQTNKPVQGASRQSSPRSNAACTGTGPPTGSTLQ